VLDAAVEPRVDKRLACEVSAPKERGYGGVREWLRMRDGEIEDRTREGDACEAVLDKTSTFDSIVGGHEEFLLLIQAEARVSANECWIEPFISWELAFYDKSRRSQFVDATDQRYRGLLIN
jgi:hypothetical protein